MVFTHRVDQHKRFIAFMMTIFGIFHVNGIRLPFFNHYRKIHTLS